eukprot:CAMPEP_0180443090 /NCGR_PEP_ID=MMETSP1036_2-20121128/14487_1 /TAXON_ID=632150 /ORGANISM="Azadinium spinosum, Strain 3D9" /LENGTH=267 /DNA_ID=CAMNT_0022449375 /DNA_START=414 /DNA_END=1218 /DNA_ORIENTATION=+
MEAGLWSGHGTGCTRNTLEGESSSAAGTAVWNINSIGFNRCAEAAVVMLAMINSAEAAKRENVHMPIPSTIWALSPWVLPQVFAHITQRVQNVPKAINATSKRLILTLVLLAYPETAKRNKKVVMGEHARTVRFTEIGNRVKLKAKQIERRPTLIHPVVVVTRVGFHGQDENEEISIQIAKIEKVMHCWSAVMKYAAGTPFKVPELSKGSSVSKIFMYMFMNVCAPKKTKNEATNLVRSHQLKEIPRTKTAKAGAQCQAVNLKTSVS